MHRSRVWFAAHCIALIERIVTDNGSCYRAKDFTHAPTRGPPSTDNPLYPCHNGKVERYNRIVAEEFLYARIWTAEILRTEALKVWNIHFTKEAGGQR